MRSPQATATNDIGAMIRNVVRILRRHALMILGILVVVMAIAVFAVQALPNRYTATADLMIDPRHINVVDTPDFVTDMPLADRRTMSSLVSLITSHSVLERVVRKNDFANEPAFVPSLDKQDKSVLGSGAALVMRWFGRAEAKEPGASLSKEEAEQTAIDTLREGLEIEAPGNAFIVQISYTALTPDRAARVVNAVTDSYLVDQLEARFDATKRATDWLSDRLASLRDEVEQAERAVEIYKADHDLFKFDGATVAEQQLSELSAQLILARAETAEHRAKYNQVQRMVSSGRDLSGIADVLQSPTISSLRAQQAELVRREAELSSRYGERHPSMIKIRAERRDFERQIESEVQRIVANLRTQYEVARTREASLQSSLDELKKGQAKGDQASIGLRELERNAESSRTLYESFLNRFKQAEEQEQLQTSNSRVVSPAVVPKDPSGPKRVLYLAGAGVLALGVGVGLAFLLEMLSNGFVTGRQLEEVIGIPTIATVPLVTKTDRTIDGKTLNVYSFAVAKPLSVYSESLRTMRTGIEFSNVDEPVKSLLITSALAGEGKSTIAVSLARISALAGQRVLLIDADIRRPTISQYMDVQEGDQPGLVELIANSATWDDVVRKDEVTDLHFIPVTKGAKIPGDLLKSDRMGQIIARATENYDFVIIDAPPLSPVVDARLIARHVDKMAIVVRWKATPRQIVSDVIHDLGEDEAKIAGLVMNQTDLAKQADYRYGSSYYYRNYKSYYSS